MEPRLRLERFLPQAGFEPGIALSVGTGLAGYYIKNVTLQNVKTSTNRNCYDVLYRILFSIYTYKHCFLN